MEEKKMRELNLAEMDKVSGGGPSTGRDGSPLKCNCGANDWTCHGWSEDYPRGYRMECNKCHTWGVYDGFNWR